MGRVKIKFPDEKPLHTSHITVRIGDINYGGHVGNDAILSIIHEARMQLVASWGYNTELDVAGNGLIMADVMIAYKGEAFYGDTFSIEIYAAEITDKSFDLLYCLKTLKSVKDIAHAKTGMVCFNYNERKISNITEALKTLLNDKRS